MTQTDGLSVPHTWLTQIRLSGVVRRAGISSVYIIRQRTGLRYTRDGFNSRWLKAKAEAKDKYPELEFDFTFHDLKVKGISGLSGSLYDK